MDHNVVSPLNLIGKMCRNLVSKEQIRVKINFHRKKKQGWSFKSLPFRLCLPEVLTLGMSASFSLQWKFKSYQHV